MKKLIVIFMAISVYSGAALATDNNILFNEYKNQIGLHGGYGIGNMNPEPANGLLMLHYSQPIQFFRLDARQNLHLGYIFSESDPWYFGGMSFDAALLSWNKFYIGAGIGAYIRNASTQRLDSRFTFGEKVFIGYQITKKFSTELFVQHYSNGDLTDKNLGYNFAGLSFNMNF